MDATAHGCASRLKCEVHSAETPTGKPCSVECSGFRALSALPAAIPLEACPLHGVGATRDEPGLTCYEPDNKSMLVRAASLCSSSVFLS